MILFCNVLNFFKQYILETVYIFQIFMEIEDSTFGVNLPPLPDDINIYLIFKKMNINKCEKYIIRYIYLYF